MLAFIGGAAVERVVIRPVEHRPEIVIVIVAIGLLILLNGLTGWIWGAEVKAFDSPFPNETWDVGGVAISVQDIGTLGVCLLAVLALWAFFRFTTLGLVMRAVANNPTRQPPGGCAGGLDARPRLGPGRGAGRSRPDGRADAVPRSRR